MNRYAAGLLIAMCAQSAPCATLNEEITRTVSFTEEGRGTASKYERVVDAQARAEQDALKKAMSNAGVDVFYGYHDLMASGDASAQFIASAMNVFSAGVAQYAQAAPPQCATAPDGTTECSARIKGTLTFRGRPDPNFEITVSGLKPAYCDGDAVELSIRGSREAYINVLSVDEERNTVLVFPTEKAAPSKEGETLALPGKDKQLLAVLPQGKTESFEMLQVIMTKKEPLFSPETATEAKAGNYTVLSTGDFMNAAKRLAGLRRSDWAMRLLPYRISKCQQESVQTSASSAKN